MLLIERSLESEHRYRLIVRLKVIEYKEDFFCYLSSTASLQGFLFLYPQIVVFPRVLHLFFCYFPGPPVTLKYVQLSPLLWRLSERIIHQDLFCRRPTYWTIQWLRTRPFLTRLHHPNYLPAKLLCRHPSIHRVVRWMVETDVDILKSRVYTASSQPFYSTFTMAPISGFH